MPQLHFFVQKEPQSSGEFDYDILVNYNWNVWLTTAVLLNEIKKRIYPQLDSMTVFIVKGILSVLLFLSCMFS